MAAKHSMTGLYFVFVFGNQDIQHFAISQTYEDDMSCRVCCAARQLLSGWSAILCISLYIPSRHTCNALLGLYPPANVQQLCLQMPQPHVAMILHRLNKCQAGSTCFCPSTTDSPASCFCACAASALKQLGLVQAGQQRAPGHLPMGRTQEPYPPSPIS